MRLTLKRLSQSGRKNKKKGLTNCHPYAIINVSKGKNEVKNYEMCKRDFRN